MNNVFFLTIKSPKVEYIETHLFLKNSAHCFKDLICANKLKGFFFKELFLHWHGAFFTTGKPLICASFFA